MSVSILRRLRNRLVGTCIGVLHTLRIGKCPLLVLHLQEIGLREQVEPVVDWLLVHDDCRVVIVVRDIQRKEYLLESSLPLCDDRRLFVVSEELFISKLYDPEVVLSLHPECPSVIAQSFAGNRKPFRVVMQHGLPDKETFFVEDGRGDTLSCYDGIFLFGPSSRQGTLRLYAHRFPEQFERLRLFDVGYPKTDALLQNGFNRAAFIAGQGLDPELPTICYAPTYQRTASLEQQGVEIIRSLASLGVNVLVKLHHVSLKPPVPGQEKWVRDETEGKDWRSIMTMVERDHRNVRLAQVHNANPCLQASDVLVTDVSGVAFEFLLLDRPLLFIDVPLLFAQFGTTGIHYWGRSCGEIVTTENLVRGVAESLADPERNAERRRELLDRLVYNPGRGGEVAGETLKRIMRNNL